MAVENRQTALPVSNDLLAQLESAGLASLKLIGQRKLALTVIPREVSVSLLDDVMIGEVHGQYMDDPSPTDVITFPYGESGEVLISVETAAEHAKEYAVGWEREVTLYLVHGILHLCGYEDADEEGRQRMGELQEALLEDVLG
ncbi:MAG: rRNA maturation RNase YbeY [Akkermansiaceae bacterium]|nr:rRNA maturation RNase YbeY [Akkermansiaceae bacterium]